MLISRLIPLASALLLAGCASMAPSYERPAVPLPAQYGAGMAPAAAAAAALEWRGYFTDSALQRLIEQALAHNHDLRTAVLRVQEAQAAYGIQRSARYPTLGLSAEAARARTPADLSLTGTPSPPASSRSAWVSAAGSSTFGVASPASTRRRCKASWPRTRPVAPPRSA